MIALSKNEREVIDMQNGKKENIQRSVNYDDYGEKRKFTCADCRYCKKDYSGRDFCELYQDRTNPRNRACDEFEEI